MVATGSAPTAAVESYDFTASLDGILRAVATRDDVSTVRSPLLLMIEGIDATVSDTQTIPVALRAVSAEGTVTTVDFEEVEVGFILTANLRELGEGSALLTVEVELGELAGFVEDRPIRNRRKLASNASIRSGGVYLIGGIELGSTLKRQQGPISLGLREEESAGLFQVWARTYRIGQLTTQGAHAETERASERRLGMSPIPAPRSGLLSDRPELDPGHAWYMTDLAQSMMPPSPTDF
jgi:hypothetical protein